MKEMWIRPVTEVQQFMANEYVAACNNSSGTTYKFVCNANRVIQLWDTAMVYLADGTSLGAYSKCGSTHEVTVPQGTDMSAVFQDGYMCSVADPFQLVKTPVIVWTDNGTNIHCTRNLSTEDWEIVRS